MPDIFLIFARNIDCADVPRRFKRVPTIYVWSKNKKNTITYLVLSKLLQMWKVFHGYMYVNDLLHYLHDQAQALWGLCL